MKEKERERKRRETYEIHLVYLLYQTILHNSLFIEKQ